MADDAFSIATFNVNSLRARLDAVSAWLEAVRPDVLALQETKVTDAEFPRDILASNGRHCFFHGQKSYNGVCLISRDKAADVRIGLGDDMKDQQARLISGRFGDVTVINTYVPQGGEVGSDKFVYKFEWLRRFKAHLERHHRPDEAIAWVGDFNVAPEDIDVYAPDFYENDVGCHPDERTLLEELRAWGFEDMFRRFHPGERKRYTFFDYRVKDSVKYFKGWRIDHIWATKPLAARALSCEIDMTPRRADNASDHTPLIARFRRE